MKPGVADPAPASPCAPWCEIPDPAESGVDLAHLAQTYPAWCCPKVDLEDPDQVAKAEWSALAVSSLLFRLSGNRFNGVCSTEEFLCLRRDRHGCWRLGFGDEWRSRPYPSGDGATWLNCAPCGRHGCDCSSGKRIHLPYTPVTEVLSVTIGDELLPPDAYTIVGDSLYLCDDGADPYGCFDACAGTGLLISWAWGNRPPPDGITAACVWTCEMIKSCNGEACSFPKRVGVVTGPGTSYTKLDPNDFMDKGRTGIIEVDQFLMAWGTEAPATVTWPEDVAPVDFGSRARTTW